MSSEVEAPSNDAWAERARAAFTPNVAPAPLLIVRGDGCRVWDAEGRSYIDAISGIAVSALGHAHPALRKALSEQAGLVLHTSNLYLNQPAVTLAERLKDLCFADRFFFCNSGADANEAAIKLARRYQWNRGESKRIEVVSFTGGFHGRTYGALAATAQPKYHEGFGPMPEGFVYVDYGDVQALDSAVHSKTAAILVEPIQGEGGVNLPPSGFLARCRELATERGAVLIADEVQTGFGRTGTMFAHQAAGVVPDILSMAKGIAAGLPLGAIGAKAEVAEALVPGTHNTTYSGSPLACRAAHVVLDVLQRPGFLEQVVRSGQVLQDGLRSMEQGLFAEVRGRGLLIGAEMREDAPFSAKDVVTKCRAMGLLAHTAGANVVRLAPPLVIGAEDVQEILRILADALAELRG